MLQNIGRRRKETFNLTRLFVENQLDKSIFQSGHFMSCLIWIEWANKKRFRREEKNEDCKFFFHRLCIRQARLKKTLFFVKT